jgi:hypothetical protein
MQVDGVPVMVFVVEPSIEIIERFLQGVMEVKVANVTAINALEQHEEEREAAKGLPSDDVVTCLQVCAGPPACASLIQTKDLCKQH